MKKTLIFDGQVFQTAAWDRGMGKYSLAMLEEMAKLWKGKYRTYLVLNKHHSLSDEARRVISGILPDTKMVFLDLHVPEIREHDFDPKVIIEKTKLNEAILSDFVTTLHLKANDRAEYIILSLFLDEVCATFPRNTINTLLFYDLIPLLFAERYSRNENYSYYLARIPIIFKADKVLAISQTVADDLSMHLGIAAERVVNIQGAPIKRRNIEAAPVADVTGPFILMTSGNDMRKNNINAVRGFEEYIASTGRTDLHLVITSHFDEHTQLDIKAFSDHLIFTGNVSEGQLKWLYEKSEAIMFVPEYEGLGLPILEAVEFSKPVICSSIGAFREMSESAFYYTNHQSPAEIAQAIGRALSGELWQRHHEEYASILKNYTWRKTAKLALQALERDSFVKQSVEKKRLAVIGPTPRGYSAIGKVLQQMHVSLAEYFEIDYFLEWGVTEHNPIRQDYLEYATNVYKATEFNADIYANYDAVIYHIGNSEYHINAIRNALYLPGYAIIHDTKLTEIFALAKNFNYLSDSRYSVEAALDQKSGVEKTAYLSSLIHNQIGIVVHSEYARDAIQEAAAVSENIPTVQKINLPTGSSKVGKIKFKSRLHVGMAGVIHEGKGLRLLESLTTEDIFNNVNFSIFGASIDSKEVMDRIEQNERIHIATNLTDREFQEEISRLDVLINYREEYRGETSLSTLEAMRMGVVSIVRNIGSYAELPDEVVIKLDDDKDIPVVLEQILEGKINLDAISEAAKKYIAANYSYESYSAQLHSLITSSRANSRVSVVEALKEGDTEEILRLIKAD